MSPMNSIFKKPFTLLMLLLVSQHGTVLSQNRIIGGQKTTISKFPFLIEISLHGVKAHPLCGATIIDKHWAVSAAHCFKDIGPKLKIEDYLVISGTTYTREKISEDKRPPSYHNISKYYMNENFGKFSPSANDGFDISVFKVDPPFEFNENTSPAQLPVEGETLDDKWAIAAGWGCTKLGGGTNSDLLYVKVPKIKSKTCKEYYSAIKYESSVLCYGTPGREKDPKNICQGDSGGPLIAQKDVLIGVVSMSKKIDAAVPALYTRVAFFRDWIKEKTGV